MCSGQHHLSFASEWDELDAPDMDNHHGRAAVSAIADKRMTCVPADSLAVSWSGQLMG